MSERDYEILLYSVTASTVAKIMELNCWEEDEALERFTSSKLYSYLEKEETKVWQYSSLMLAKLFNEECRGKLVFPKVDMSKTLEFKAFCFEAYRNEKKLTGSETMSLFKKYGVLDYINTCFDVLHTTSRDYIVEDIDIFIEKRKNK